MQRYREMAAAALHAKEEELAELTARVAAAAEAEARAAAAEEEARAAEGAAEASAARADQMTAEREALEAEALSKQQAAEARAAEAEEAARRAEERAAAAEACVAVEGAQLSCATPVAPSRSASAALHTPSATVPSGPHACESGARRKDATATPAPKAADDERATDRSVRIDVRTPGSAAGGGSSGRGGSRWRAPALVYVIMLHVLLLASQWRGLTTSTSHRCEATAGARTRAPALSTQLQ